MAGELSEAFEQFLRSLPDSEWDALSARVRTPKGAPPDPYAAEQKRQQEVDSGRHRFKNAGIEEAYRRGYVDKGGKPIPQGGNR